MRQAVLQLLLLRLLLLDELHEVLLVLLLHLHSILLLVQLLLQLLLLKLLEADLALVFAQLSLLGDLLQCIDGRLQGREFVPEDALPVLAGPRLHVKHLGISVHRTRVDAAVSRGVPAAARIQQEAARRQGEIGGYMNARCADGRHGNSRSDRGRGCRRHSSCRGRGSRCRRGSRDGCSGGGLAGMVAGPFLRRRG